jgi:5-formyltetrahydrofolate cyclo-ligase
VPSRLSTATSNSEITSQFATHFFSKARHINDYGREHPVYPRDFREVIAPMPGFDKRGYHLRYVAGYYNRFLSASPNLLKNGLVFPCPETTIVPVDAHDNSMDLIMTVPGINICGNPPVPVR